MNRLLLFWLFLLIHFSSFAQRLDNLWLLGYQSGLGPPVGGMTFDFSSGSLNVSYTPRPMNIATTLAVMCNYQGQLLFYTNGDYVANALDDTMMNGRGLSPSYYTNSTGWDGLGIPQAAFAIPWPDQPGRYMLFHNTIDDSIQYRKTWHLYFSEIDMSLDNGLGAVVNKNTVILSDTIIWGRITGVKHANGRDWWVLTHGFDNNKFYIFKIDPSGVSLHAIQQIGVPLDSDQGQAAFSPDGTKYAIFDAYNDLQLFDFDRCAGVLSNPLFMVLPGTNGYGVVFSPNSKVMYATGSQNVWQFDLTAANIASTMITVAVWDGFYSPNPPFATTFYQGQLAPDNRIYISSTNSVTAMHYIEYPDSLGLACNVCQHCVSLPAFHIAGVPNYPNFYLGPVAGSICDSLTTGVSNNYLRNEDAILVFPNPVREKMYVKAPLLSSASDVVIFNTLGQRQRLPVIRISNGEYLEIDTRTLVPGLYYVEVLTSGGKVVRRFVKE